MSSLDIPWDNPDLAFSAGGRVYLTFEQLQKIKERIRKLEAVAEAAKDYWDFVRSVNWETSDDHSLAKALAALEH